MKLPDLKDICFLCAIIIGITVYAIIETRKTDAMVESLDKLARFTRTGYYAMSPEEEKEYLERQEREQMEIDKKRGIKQ